MPGSTYINFYISWEQELKCTNKKKLTPYYLSDHCKCTTSALLLGCPEHDQCFFNELKCQNR